MVVRRVILVLLVLVGFTSLLTNTALAIDAPDKLEVIEVKGYSGVIEPGDMLITAHYNIEYTVLPTERASEAFLARLLDGTIELQATSPYPFFANGYGEGVFSFYFTPDQVDSLALVHGGPYTVRLQGSPSLFAVPPTINNGSIEWRHQLVTKLRLREDLVRLAQDLEAAWATGSVNLIETTPEGNVFTAEGDTYFSNSIPDLRLMIPQLFSGRAVAPRFDEREFDKSYAEQLREFWTGSLFGDVRDAWAALTKTDGMLLTTLILVAFNIFLAWWSFKLTQRPDFAPIIVAVIWPIGAYIGMTDMILAGLMAAMAILGTTYMLFLRRG